MFFLILLTSCSKSDPQGFIYRTYDREADGWKYYKTTLDAPSEREEMNITPCSEDARVQPYWSPDGNYYGCGAVYQQPLLIRDAQNTITAMMEQGDPKDPTNWDLMGWSPDSQYVSIVNPYHDFSIMKYDGTGLQQILQYAEGGIGPAEWSPNGRYIALQLTPYRTSQSFIVVFDPVGKEIGRFDISKSIDDPMVIAEDLTWSPDSKKLAFHTNYNMTHNSALYVLDLESGNVTDISPDAAICVMTIFDWSPDSQEIVFNAIHCKEHLPGDLFDQIAYSIHVDGSNLKALTGKGHGSLHWSPDGKSILIDGYEGKDLYWMGTDGSNKKKLVDSGNKEYAYFVSWIRP